MKKNLATVILLLMLNSCAVSGNNEGLSPDLAAQQFMQDLLHAKPDIEKSVTADIAFLDGHTQNSQEGQRILHNGLQMMAQYLRQTIEDAGIDSEKAVFVPVPAPVSEEKQTNVILQIYNPNQDSKKEINAAQLITRWRHTDKGWKLDMNPYLDNFRHLK